MYELKELGDDGEIENFINAAGLKKDFQKKLVKKRIMELPRPPAAEPSPIARRRPATASARSGGRASRAAPTSWRVTAWCASTA